MTTSVKPIVGYAPDVWVIVKKQDTSDLKPRYFILAGNTGGYLDGDTFRFSTDIKNIFYDAKQEYFKVDTKSGSVYILHKRSQRMSSYTASIYFQIESNDTSLVLMEDIINEFTDIT